MMYQKKFILPGDGEGARPVQDEIIQQVEAHDYNTSCTFAIRLALEEALSNAIKHGCKMDPQKEVTLDCSISDEVIEINIQDQGPDSIRRSFLIPPLRKILKYPPAAVLYSCVHS